MEKQSQNSDYTKSSRVCARNFESHVSIVQNNNENS
jgi:hypothetical protein